MLEQSLSLCNFSSTSTASSSQDRMKKKRDKKKMIFSSSNAWVMKNDYLTIRCWPYLFRHRWCIMVTQADSWRLRSFWIQHIIRDWSTWLTTKFILEVVVPCKFLPDSQWKEEPEMVVWDSEKWNVIVSSVMELDSSSRWLLVSQREMHISNVKGSLLWCQ